jgi:hypothetical protein
MFVQIYIKLFNHSLSLHRFKNILMRYFKKLFQKIVPLQSQILIII